MNCELPTTTTPYHPNRAETALFSGHSRVVYRARLTPIAEAIGNYLLRLHKHETTRRSDLRTARLRTSLWCEEIEARANIREDIVNLGVVNWALFFSLRF